MLVLGAFWLGWTGQYARVHWIVPALATVPIGAAVSLVFNGFLAFLVDTYLQYAASAFSANTIVRSCVGAAFPLFTVQMFRALGIAWACTLVGLCGLLLAPSPFVFYKYGPRIRAKSKFSPCPVSFVLRVFCQECHADRCSSRTWPLRRRSRKKRRPRLPRERRKLNACPPPSALFQPLSIGSLSSLSTSITDTQVVHKLFPSFVLLSSRHPLLLVARYPHRHRDRPCTMGRRRCSYTSRCIH